MLFLNWTFVDEHIVPHLDARGLMCLALTSKSFTQPEIAAALKRILARSLRESLEKFNAHGIITGRNFMAALKRYMRPSRIPVKFTGPRWKAFRFELVVQRVLRAEERDVDAEGRAAARLRREPSVRVRLAWRSGCAARPAVMRREVVAQNLWGT